MYAAPWRGEICQPAFYRQILHSSSEHIQEVQAHYKPVPFPLHLIWGQHYDNIPVSQGRQLAEALAADSLTVVSEAAHMVMEDAPEGSSPPSPAHATPWRAEPTAARCCRAFSASTLNQPTQASAYARDDRTGHPYTAVARKARGSA